MSVLCSLIGAQCLAQICLCGIVCCVRKHLLVLGAYTLLALVLTWPLAANFTTHVVGDGSDDPALTWNLWWFKHALLDLHTSPLTTDFMFYPIGINLVFYTLTLLNDALSLPLQAVFGLVPAANMLLLSSFVLCGYGMFLLVEELGIADWGLETGDWAAFIAGIVFAFSSNKMLYASLGQFNIASSQWIPFYVLYLFKLRSDLFATHRTPLAHPVPRAIARKAGECLRHRTSRHSLLPARHAILAATFLLLQAYAEFTFASFLIVFTFFFWLWHWRARQSFWRMTLALALVAIVFVVGFAPIIVPMIQELRVEGDYLVQGSGFADAFSADVIGFFVPSKLNPIVGWLDTWFEFPYINFVFVGWLTLALALIGARVYRRYTLAKFWSVTTLAFAVIALGPELRVNGNAFPIPLPFAVFQVLPFFKGNRYPSRYSVMITLGVAVLVAFGVQYLLVKARKLGEIRGDKRNKGHALISPNLLLSSLISFLILVEHFSVLPLSDYRAPSFYDEIRNEPGDFAVLEIPLDWRNSFRVTGTLDKVFMLSQFYQTVHEKRMLSGNTSRNPELKFQYFTEAPLINSLIALETGHDLDAATLAQDKQYAPEVMRFFNVRYIVLRAQAGGKVQPWLEAVLPDLKLWRDADGTRLYRLSPSPAQRGRAGVGVDPKSPMARLYFADGWGELGEQRVWAQRNETRLLMPKQDTDVVLTLRVTVPDEGQKLTVLVNGGPAGSFALQKGTKDYGVQIKMQGTPEGLNELTLRWTSLFSTWYLPSETGQPDSYRFVVVKSAGEEVGDFAHIWIDGEDRSPNQRGYNLLAFITGINSADYVDHFDTFASSNEADRLAQFLEHDKKFHNVALAVRDEASLSASLRLAMALKSEGSKLPVGWRSSHAFVRYITVPGENIIIREDASPIRPAIVSIGERITSPTVAGAVEWIQVQPTDEAK